MKTIKIYCGESVSNKSIFNLTPLQWVRKAKKFLEDKETKIYCNSPDFCSAINTLIETKPQYNSTINLEFYWDNELVDIEGLFSKFNECFNELDSY